MTQEQISLLVWFLLIAWFVAGSVVSRNRRVTKRAGATRSTARVATGTPKSRQTGPGWEQDTPYIFEEDF